ncbi:MAG: hypothetical protein IK954_03345 [Clostridia bacterium]|nr:hypothetical protein [Clostridia bacterium]
MKRFLTKENLIAAGVACGVTLLFCVSAIWHLRHLTGLIEMDETFTAIFSQLENARVLPPWFLLLALSAASAFGLKTLFRRHQTAAVLLGLLVLLLLLALAFLLSTVNGILVADVLFSLVNVLLKGGF